MQFPPRFGERAILRGRSERDVAAPRERRAPALDAFRPVHRAPDREEVAQALAALSALLVLVVARSEEALELAHERLLLPCHETRLRLDALLLDKAGHGPNVSRAAF